MHMILQVQVYIFDWPMYDMVWVFTNRLEDQVSIPGGVLTVTQKMVLDASLLEDQHH